MLNINYAYFPKLLYDFQYIKYICNVKTCLASFDARFPFLSFTLLLLQISYLRLFSSLDSRSNNLTIELTER